MALKPYYARDGITIYHGDCIEVLAEIKGVAACVTDPPYSSGGMFRGAATVGLTTQQEFFRLAAVWLDCRQHSLLASTTAMRVWHFLGEMDYGAEMELMVREESSVRLKTKVENKGKIVAKSSCTPKSSVLGS